MNSIADSSIQSPTLSRASSLVSAGSSSQSWGIAVVRMVAGVVFLAHGYQKLFSFGFHGVAGFFGQAGIPVPAVSAVVVTLVEFLGGAALLLGLFTRAAALLLAIDMAGAILFVHLKNGFFLPTGFEFALTMLAVNMGLVLAGPGALAIENQMGRRA